MRQDDVARAPQQHRGAVERAQARRQRVAQRRVHLLGVRRRQRVVLARQRARCVSGGRHRHARALQNQQRTLSKTQPTKPAARSALQSTSRMSVTATWGSASGACPPCATARGSVRQQPAHAASPTDALRRTRTTRRKRLTPATLRLCPSLPSGVAIACAARRTARGCRVVRRDGARSAAGGTSRADSDNVHAFNLREAACGAEQAARAACGVWHGVLRRAALVPCSAAAMHARAGARCARAPCTVQTRWTHKARERQRFVWAPQAYRQQGVTRRTPGLPLLGPRLQRHSACGRLFMPPAAEIEAALRDRLQATRVVRLVSQPRAEQGRAHSACLSEMRSLRVVMRTGGRGRVRRLRQQVRGGG